MLSGHSKLAGVIGWPVSHSRSPRLHNYWLGSAGIDGAYVPLPVQPGQLQAALKGLVALGFRGANVTVPHKEEAYALVDSLDTAAQQIGAVNTLVIDQETGKIEGRNTDAHGFMAHLDHAAPNWGRQQPAVVLGAGGAARAVIYALRAAGVPEIRVVNRSLARAQALEESFGPTMTALPWPSMARAMNGAGLLVNTTTLGMTGQPPLECPITALPADATVYDLVYNPLQTPLLQSAQARGLRIVDGLGMLIHQARPGFAAWFGCEPPAITPELTDYLLKA